MGAAIDWKTVVVLVHGSEHDSARDTYALQRLFPAEGIAAFVHDKRGTGASGGTYTQDFNVLADDAIAAMNDAKRLAGTRVQRFGYQGGSAGGWIVPLAANRAPVDFAIVSFGLAVTILEEDTRKCRARYVFSSPFCRRHKKGSRASAGGRASD
jgi:alpha-beta hydrolase superfamily lysophospholipase